MSDHQAGAGPQQPPQTLNVGGQTVRLQQVLTAAGTRGQQFVITSQVSVPGLTQVIPTIATTTAALQQAGVTRILNIAPSPRVNVVGVSQVPGRGGTLQLATTNTAGNNGTSDSPGRSTVSLVAIGQPTTVNASSHPTLVSSLSSPPRQRTAGGTIGIVQSPPPTLVLTSPNLVRTCGTFATPLSSASNLVPCPQTSAPARKRLRLSELQERPPPNEEVGALRRKVLEHKMAKMRVERERYAEHAFELFFLQAGGIMIDYHAWRKRSPTPQFLHFLRSHRLDPEDDDEDLTLLLSAASTSGSTQSSQSTEIKIPGVGATPVAISTTLPPAVAQLNQQGGTPLVLEHVPTSNNVNSVSSGPVRIPPGSAVSSPDKSSVAGTSPSKLNKLPAVAPTARQHTRQHSISAVYDTSIGSQEQIAEKAKQEAYVMQRIAELQREGLWSEKRLPKVQEPPRVKAHWDYLLEEMIWLAADFAQERKWKKAAAKKCARNVQKYFQEKAIQAQKAEKVQELRLKKIASFIAKEVKTFWSNVEKLVEYKQQTRLEEKRKKALDQHLSFIVDQTEKYSNWLAESMNKTGLDSVNPSVPASVNSSRISSPTRQMSDDEFQPNQSSTDDEETIAKAEEDMGTLGNIEEVEMLKRESELPLEDLLKELPDDYLENRDKDISSEKSLGGDDASSRGDDDEFTVASDKDSSDDEETIQEQEDVEGKVDHKKELEDLQADNEMSIEDLMEKYGCGSGTLAETDPIEGNEDSDGEDDDEEDEDVSGDDNEGDSQSSSEDDRYSVQSNEGEVGLKSLLDEGDENTSSEKKAKDNEAAGKEISDVAALAESIQPKGNTLSSTSVVTTIPFLLKHTLREYQHIGLDWLVTMFDRKLNGILADEMGLGKTIQTISLLAHLACEKGNWGPHLIIVPTSVMLNWEMELKKWCPAFKILTYYGSQKERKQKRTGWTKPNAFHICITSYKLVIQDHQSFRRKKWKYLILDEAQNIKNFKSQRWQLLLNFQTQRRLLLTGTPLQNNLMELWSLMHFLMPNVFQSHREFKEWFSNPVTGMIEGNSEYNESLIKRLHKVLRPFLLRRLKTEVEKQLPKKYEHIVMCRLSKRQRFLYDDFMSRAKTRETLSSGNLLSVINVLMQLRKVCNHPNLFEVRPTISPFQMEGITYETASLVTSALDYDPFKQVDLFSLNLLLVDLEVCLTAFVAHRIKKYRAPKKLIEEIDSAPEPPPRCPPGKIKIHVRLSSQQQQQQQQHQQQQQQQHQQQQQQQVASGPAPQNKVFPLNVTTARVGTSPLIKTLTPQTGQGVTLRVTGGTQLQGYSVQLVQHQGGVKAIPVATLGPTPHQVQPQGSQQPQTLGVQVKPGDGIQRFSVPAGFAQLVQTSTGRHILLTPSAQVIQPLSQNPGTTTVMTASGHRLTVLPKSVSGVSTTTVTTVNRMAPTTQVTSTSVAARPVMRVPPLNMSSAVQASLGTLVNTVVAGTTTVTTTTTVTSTKTCAALTQPVLAALVQQSQRNNATAVTSSIVTRSDTKVAEQRKRKQEIQVESQSVFYLPELEEKRRARRKAKLEMLNKVNQRRCAACPIYGADLIEAMRFVDVVETRSGDWRGAGYVHCLNAKKQCHKPDRYWSHTDAMKSIIHTPEQYVRELGDIFSRYVLCVPAVSAPHPKFHVSHPPPSKFWAMKRTQAMLQQELSSHSALLHPIASAMVTQFPDPRLIQYDCGKLQVLDRLLRQLKAGHHRVLIFTQMTRMLDVLEAFLNFHGHIYLRLDGTTRVDQRQILMERFNADRRIFCFILSTRSGGIGVNLTGADTVIFYDSDWNPTMDAQAQDRCHRIGQTRDVHIYRLVSEKTVEENILKKANQKRLLGDLAIEGGNFTTAYFKSSTIQDLFNIDVAENDASRRMAEVLDRENEREARRQKDETQQLPASPHEDKAALGALESALAAAEDETDVQAARTAKAEAVADLAEFDETIPLEEGEAAGGTGEPEMSKAELEVHNLIQQLTPVERYAMKFVEDTEAAWSAEQLAAAEAEIEQQKREWEIGRLQALKEEEERRARLTDDDDQLLTFSHEDAHNQVWVSQNAREQMPMWCPPTPPQDDNDVYIDHSMGFLYEQTIMSEAQLPVVYVKKEHKRLRMDVLPASEREGRRPMKMRKEESMHAPRSLFDRPSPALTKMRRDMKLQKCRGIMRTPSSISGLKPPAMVKPMPELENVPEWVVHEDWALLQAVQGLLELPLNLMVLSPGHTPNWDMVADMVNNVSRIYRGPKQCRIRYENHIVPREEGKILYDTNPKKQKKTKSMYKLPPQTKTNRPMRTSQLYMQDNNTTYTQLYIQRFETIKAVSNKRTPTVKPLLVNPTMRNPKHAAVLADCGIIYDQPLTPIEVATRRAERIAKEKQKTAAAVLTAEQQQLVAAQRLQQQQAAAKSAAATPAVAPAAASPGPTTPTPVPSSTPQTVVVGLSQAQMNAASPQQIGTVVSVAGTTVIQTGSVATLSPALSRVQRPVTTLTVQDMVAAGQVRAVANTQAVVSVANLTPAQVQAAQRLATANLVSQAQTAVTAVATKGAVTTANVTVGGKTLTAAQLHYYKQHQMARHQQQRLLLREQQQLKVIQAQTAAGQSNQKVSVAVTTGTPMGIATVAGVTAVQVSPAQQQRAQFIKQGIAGSKQTIARAMSESEMAALIKRQQQQQQLAAQQQKAGGTQVAQVQVPTQTALTPAQILAQAGLQVQPAGTSGQTQVATLVKTVSAPGSVGTSQSVTIPVTSMTIPSQVKATLAPGAMKTATQHQIRQLALHQQQLVQQRKLPQQKMAQLTQVSGKAGVPAQLIVQSQKAMPTTMTVQQIQQVIKHVQPQSVQHIAHVSGGQAVSQATSGNQVISHAVLTKAPQVSGPGQTLQTRVIPVSSTQQSLKQTIQVVTASPGVRTSVPNVTIDSAGRPQVSVASTLASALAGTIKVAPSSTAQQQALLSQVNAVLQQQGQPMSVAVRQAQSPVRIQTSAAGTPLVAVTVHQPIGAQTQGIPTVVTTQQVLTSQQQAVATSTASQSSSSQETSQ